ncbi:hypothetical protein TIFTF001_006591 [Ficus carica]|uniref:Uncharacterized protein n=1 Tax=Ficus carica TaxID=3494 RepID=A0AA87ZJ99_FICCA|nr:hypothetical protein TIFTF001_006591 [Ficus carica]
MWIMKRWKMQVIHFWRCGAAREVGSVEDLEVFVMLVWSFWTDRNDFVFNKRSLGVREEFWGTKKIYGRVNGVGSRQERLHKQPWSRPPHGPLSKKITGFFFPLVAESLAAREGVFLAQKCGLDSWILEFRRFECCEGYSTALITVSRIKCDS